MRTITWQMLISGFALQRYCCKVKGNMNEGKVGMKGGEWRKREMTGSKDFSCYLFVMEFILFTLQGVIGQLQ